MNLVLLKKSFRESRWLLLGTCAIMFVVHWLRVWISSLFSTDNLSALLSYVPPQFEKLMPVPFSQVATSAGRIAVAYDDPVVLLLVTVWAISRGSDAVSGELNRGTMEMLLAQPVRRTGVLAAQATATLLGAVALAGSALGATTLGLSTITLESPVSPTAFVPAALNLFSITVFLAGLTTMVSAGSNYRSRTIGAVGGLYAASMILKVVGRMAPGWGWVAYASFFTLFEPQQLVGDADKGWSLCSTNVHGCLELGGLGYDSILVGLGLACYVVAAIIFARRDLPAPL